MKKHFLTRYVDELVYEMFEGEFILYPHTKILIFCSSLDIDPSHGAKAKKEKKRLLPPFFSLENSSRAEKEEKRLRLLPPLIDSEGGPATCSEHHG